MQYELLSRPAMTVAKLTLAAGETVTCEVGAMIAMNGGFNVETTSRKKGGGGGIAKGLKRMFAGENFFLNHFTATQHDQSLIIGPQLLGDIMYYQMTGGTLIVQGSSWLASSTSIDIDATWQGLGKALFSGESMFWVKCSGVGDLLLNSFGAIHCVEVNGEYVVDTGHIVAFEDTLQFRIGKASKSLVGSVLGGEGLVCKFSGQGKLYFQSHNPPSFGKLLGPKLKPR
ncbi:TIGR00266 family protein [Stieleria sp. JC731]|uniref:TIGR00266 family protein n=1 Tax=Pirellulaceae TaxID=2691357 RepID=UPI001E54166D|nr:TIGR00266 family protein [Stieleria sp. JC731]MCC9602927.1 TIGR00266 family protein [Stieleria sp. JC731]